MSFRRRTSLKRPRGRLWRLARALHWALRAFLILLIVDLFYVTVTWPDWSRLATGPIPKSNFIDEYQQTRTGDKRLPPLRWHPVPLSVIPKKLIRAVILAEDSRFYQHSGFDLIAFKEAIDYNLSEGRFALGASTISQQTVKNLYLSAARTPIRKWHELILTWGMERNLSKNRILEIYLNIAELGTGIYGVQSAAQAYWGVSVSEVSVEQAAELAATLPSPTKNNPKTRTGYFRRRTHRILNLLTRYPGEAAGELAAERLHGAKAAAAPEPVDGPSRRADPI